MRIPLKEIIKRKIRNTFNSLTENFLDIWDTIKWARNSELNQEVRFENPLIQKTKIGTFNNDFIWIEKALLKLNNDMVGQYKPEPRQGFLQKIPEEFLTRGKLTPDIVAKGALKLIKSASEKIGDWTLPSAIINIEFTSNLPK